MCQVLFFFVVFLCVQNARFAPEGRLCARSSSTVAHLTIELSDETDEMSESGSDGARVLTDAVTGVQYVRCAKETHHCYAVWQEDSALNGSVVIMGQGCWESSGKSRDCERSQCLSDKRPSKAMNNTKFCCCSGDFCNTNVTDIYVPTSEDTKILPPATEYLEQTQQERHTVIVWSISICSLLFAFFVAVLAYHIWQARNTYAKPSPDTAHLVPPGYTSGLYSVDHLKLCSIVGQGRYGSVWKGVVNEQEVAVKIFPAHYRTYFYNERDIYCLPFMDNPALLSYYGCDERTNMDGHMEYLLVLSYAPNGCLQEYLTENVLDFPTFCKMSLSIAKGLAHLHTDFVKGDKLKPCITHRDLNSRNILVKNDLSCCLCDLGFAMKIAGSKYYHNGEEQHAEMKSINEVGTRRYMAPEVLEGAVNLRDCETSLKQIDVYALGLVLWELAVRCVDLYQPNMTEPPAYKLPFEQEIGLHPTLEQMQALVSRHKARPLFPAQMKDTPATRLVRDTAEDCWDQDAEARLTALCVEERLGELPLLRDRNRATMYSTSPTFNPTQSNPSIINNNHLNSSNFHNDVNRNQPMTDSDHTGSISQPYIDKDTLYDVSDGTVETLLSPSDPGDHSFKNSNQTAAYTTNGLVGQYRQTSVPLLQPYQGRNPCLERNLMLPTESTDSLQYGQRYVDKSFKHVTDYRVNSNTESQGLISHDYLGQNGYHPPVNRPITPIPFVQNVVYEHVANLPKQHNIPPPGDTRLRQRFHGLLKLFDRRLFGRERLEPLPNEEEPKSNLLHEHSLMRKLEPLDTQVKVVNNGMGNGVITSVLQDDSKTRRPCTLPLAAAIATGRDQGELREQPLRCSDSTSGISQIVRRNNSLGKQHSLEQFNEVFSSTGDLSRLKDPSQRIKTPGDVPPSVRRNRGKCAAATRFSLYDDRMMSADGAHWASVPDDMDITVETVTDIQISADTDLKPTNRDSVSSF